MNRDYLYNVGSVFEKLARTDPNAIALRLPDRDIRYGELSERSDRLAACMGARGFKKRDVIGIVHKKGLDGFALMLAALKTGVVYFNIDEQNPGPRLEHIFATARPRAIFADDMPATVVAANRSGAELVEISSWADDRRSPADGLRTISEDVTGSDPAYIMYTSGSTGVPKGALMSHANVIMFAGWVGARFGVGPGDVLSNVNPMYFDNSVFDFYGGLLNGAAIAPIPRELLNDPPAMLRGLENAGCTLWFSVPSLLIYLMTLKLLQPERLPTVRSFVFGGEGYPKPELRKLHRTFGSRSKLINVYGPTECTCMCSAWDVREDDLEEGGGFVTLGPIAENFSMLVLDGQTPVDAGAVGELCLLGPQVGLGYVNDEARTRKSFVQNPLNAAWAERMYRTGDLVRLRADGMLDFIGRADNQVKHMGYRIELEEIEAAINQIAGVTQCAVLLREGRRDLKILVGYIAADSELAEEQLRTGLMKLLPPYMIPQRFSVRQKLPKNANGKVDRIALAREEI